MRGVLAIEGSQRVLGVALACGGDEIVSVESTEDPRERDLLLPAINELCGRGRMLATDLKAVAVSTGPGGFTGLRVSVATAKGLCEALEIPAIDVPSALVAAAATMGDWSVVAPRVVVALASKGERCWASNIVIDGSGELRVEWECAVGIDEFVRSAPAVVVADEYLPAPMREWCKGSGIPLVVPRFCAVTCLRVAMAKFGRGETVDAIDLRPRYPREPEAVTLWRARQAE